MNFDVAVKDLIQSSDFIPDLLGEKPTSVMPLAGGTVSAVYRALLTDGASIVLKFSEDAEELLHERLFLAAWAERGVRTPSVLQYRRLPDDLLGALLLMEYVAGDNLLPLVNAGAVDNERVLADLGRIQATMHQVTTTGFGQVTVAPDGEIRGDKASLDESLRTSLWDDLLEANLDNGDLRDHEIELVGIARKLLTTHWAKPDGALIHDDFRAGNVLYDAAHAEPYIVIDPHPAVSHPYLCLAYSQILPEIYGNHDHATYIQQGYESISTVDDEALHGARFLKALELLPRWGQPDRPVAPHLRQLFHQEKSWLRAFSS